MLKAYCLFVLEQGSLDMKEYFNAPTPNVVKTEYKTPVKKVDSATDLFSLLYISDAKQDRVVVPPSRWATFNCKNIPLRLTNVFFCIIHGIKVCF